MSKNKNILVTLVFIIATFINVNAEIQNNFSINYWQFRSETNPIEKIAATDKDGKTNETEGQVLESQVAQTKNAEGQQEVENSQLPKQVLDTEVMATENAAEKASDTKTKTGNRTDRYVLAQYNLNYIFNSGFLVGGNVGLAYNINKSDANYSIETKDRFLNGTIGLNLGYKINKFVSIVGNINYFMTYNKSHYGLLNLGAKFNLMDYVSLNLMFNANRLLKEEVETSKKASFGFAVGLGVNF